LTFTPSRPNFKSKARKFVFFAKINNFWPNIENNCITYIRTWYNGKLSRDKMSCDKMSCDKMSLVMKATKCLLTKCLPTKMSLAKMSHNKLSTMAKCLLF
jgi:hypothetical protein